MATSNDFLPTKDAQLAQWANNFDTQITASPAAVGLSIAQAAEFTAVNTVWQAAYLTSVEPSTAGPSATAAKNSARKPMKEKARELAAIIRAFPALTDQQRVDLWLTVPDPNPSPVPVPTSAPDILIDKTEGNLVTVRLRDAENPDSRGKPDGVAGASIYQFIGAQPPSLGDIEAWTFHGNTTRVLNTLDFSDEQPGATIWLTSVWFNTRMDSGPATDPVVVQLPGTYQQAA